MNKRQKFLTEARYVDFLVYSEETKEFWDHNTFESDSPEQEASLRATHFKNVALKKLLISYTGGVEISALEPMLEELIRNFERRQEMLALSEKTESISPLAIDDWLDEYEEFVQVASLCILLHRTDLLERFAALLDAAGYCGQDALYEDLLCKVLPDREDIDDWYHDVYTPLLQAIYADDKEVASDLLTEYCEQWYPAFKQAPWHDSHLQGDEGSYVGYWAIEAGTIAYLYGIDDSQIDHMVYPKDLVEYARSHAPTA
ncbi:PoNe immunity protein domain-containing protein [Pseudomonas sp. NPDC087598]|uniref:PoNe immunity protein domain-containing protein n=1 Tax=Pseudomonas sp. NPDC087598 TaxID=3364440 RepID=UPI00382C67BE